MWRDSRRRIFRSHSLEVRQIFEKNADHTGSLQFHNLHLKKTLLDRFGLPVDIVAGDIGNLSVSIPWTALKTQPVKIIIDDVYVLARARPQGNVDPEADAKKEQAAKQDKLKSAEALDEAANDVGATAGSDQGMLRNMARLIVRQSIVYWPIDVENRG
jgi:hypothetical protein